MTWVRGAELSLVREVCGHIRSCAAPPSAGYVVLFASEQEETVIWTACTQYPPPGQKRLVVVHEAGRLTKISALTEVCASVGDISGVSLLFVGEGFEEGQLAVQASPRGQVINCSFPQDAVRAEQEKITWLTTQLDGNRDAARAVLDLASGDFGAAAAVCDTMKRCGFGPERAAEVAAWHSSLPFADSLVLGERKAALRGAEVLPGEEIGQVIGQLSQRLGIMSALYWATQENATGKELHKAVPEVPAFLVSRFRKVVSQYSPQRMRQQRELLDIADSAYRNGAREGVLELLCAGW